VDAKALYRLADLGRNEKALFFDRIGDAFNFMEARVMEGLSGNSRDVYERISSDSNLRVFSRDPDWYGTTDLNLINERPDTFLFTDRLNEFIEQMVTQTVRSDKRDINQKPKIVFTEMERGIFSFDLASLGLIRVFEYYSPLLKRAVDPNRVKSYKVGGRQIFYHVPIEQIPIHPVRWDSKNGHYFSDLLKRKVEQDMVVSEGNGVFMHRAVGGVEQHEVERRQKVSEDGNPEFRSTWKKSFVYLEKVKKKMPRIDLVIASSYSANVKARTQMLYACMAPIAVARKLQESGVRFRVFVVTGGRCNQHKKQFIFTKVKDDNQPLNENGLAAQVSDPRYFRLNMFKLMVGVAQELGWQNDVLTQGIFYPINDEASIRTAFINSLRYFKDFDGGDDVIEESKIVFGTVLNERDAIALYNRKIDQIQATT